MKSIKGWLTTGIMVAMIALGSTVARAGDGIIIGGGSAYAGDPTSKDGIIIGGGSAYAGDPTSKDGTIYGQDGSIIGIICGYFGIMVSD